MRRQQIVAAAVPAPLVTTATFCEPWKTRTGRHIMPRGHDICAHCRGTFQESVAEHRSDEDHRTVMSALKNRAGTSLLLAACHAEHDGHASRLTIVGHAKTTVDSSGRYLRAPSRLGNAPTPVRIDRRTRKSLDLSEVRARLAFAADLGTLTASITFHLSSARVRRTTERVG
jgi:hypothetical protein